MNIRRVAGLLSGGLAGVATWDVLQRRHAVLRNFPLIGHLRFLLEAIGPELRQYIVTDNDQERPFSRDQRRWVYASSKKENAYFGFGTDNTVDTAVVTAAMLLTVDEHDTQVPDAAVGDDVQLWPQRHGTDAMYLALLRVGGA